MVIWEAVARKPRVECVSDVVDVDGSRVGGTGWIGLEWMDGSAGKVKSNSESPNHRIRVLTDSGLTGYRYRYDTIQSGASQDFVG